MANKFDTEGNDSLSRLIKHNPLYLWMFHVATEII